MSRWLEAALASEPDSLGCAISANSAKSPEIPPNGTNGTSGTGQSNPPIITNTSTRPFGIPINPEDWAEWIEERAAIIEFDGYRSPQEALQSAYFEVLEAWCSQYWEVPSPDSCAACGAPNPGFECGDGAAVCRRQDHSCLIEYGTKRKQAAIEWLRKAEIEPPEGNYWTT